MSIAEETSLIIPIGKWVIEQACHDLKQFFVRTEKDLGKPVDLFMSVNISGRQFHDKEFFDHLKETAEKFEVPYEKIKLEVTERIFMEEKRANESIAKARNLGFPIALDDFGTGYSSLSYLSDFAVDSLKIDRSFVKRMMEDRKAFSITKAIIDMAKGLDIPVIAEGIEKKEDFNMLSNLGCIYGQGYMISRPMPFEDTYHFLLNSLKNESYLAS